MVAERERRWHIKKYLERDTVRQGDGFVNMQFVSRAGSRNEARCQPAPLRRDSPSLRCNRQERGKGVGNLTVEHAGGTQLWRALELGLAASDISKNRVGNTGSEVTGP